MSDKFLIIWDLCWVASIPVVFWLSFKAGRRWAAKSKEHSDANAKS